MTEPVLPGGTSQSGSEPTRPIPPTPPTGPSYAAPAGPSYGAPAVPPSGPPAAPPSGPPAGPPYASPGGPPPRPPKGPGLFRQATSTTGGLIALIVAGCLAVLLVLGLIGAGLLVGSRVLGLHREVGVAQAGPPYGRQLAPGQRKRLMGTQPGPGSGANGNGNGGRNGKGLGSLLGGAAGLGAVQHGDFTVQGADGTSTAMTLQRGTVTAASGTSVSVKSTDGFTATYVVDSSTRGRTANLAKGDDVLVIAQKAGAKAVLIRAVTTP
jgi:hypothetical protein